MSLKLREFIKKIRACKTADEERCLVNKECAEIRNLSKDQAEHLRVRSLAKCICISLLGYSTEFVHMTCLELLASTKFTEKRLAYLGVCMLLDEKSEVLLLTSHTIKIDLENPNQYIVAAALNAIGETATPDMCRDTSSEVLKCLSSSNPYIKKKACLALCKIIRNCPEIIDTVADKLKLIFEDKNHGVLLSGLALVSQIFKADKAYIRKYSKYVHHLIKFLKSLSTTNYAPEYDINGVTDPFLQVKILEVLGLFGTIFEEENEEMSTLLASLSTNTDSQKNTGNAVLYELVRTIFMINSSGGLKTLGSTILGKFLEHKDNNYKYIALNSLYDISKIDIAIVQKHKNTILEFLKDNDISIKRRSLDLIYLIVNSSNIKQIISESLNFLNTRENTEFLEELIHKIYESLEKYSPSLKWQIDILLNMLCVSEDKVPDYIISKITNTIIEAKALHQYSMFRFFIAMKSNIEQESLIRVGVYLLGEFGHLIINTSALVEDNESVTIKEEDIMELLMEIKEKNFKEKIKTILVNCYFKLVNKESIQSQEKLKQLLIEETKSFFCEVQDRATEYVVFLNNANGNLKRQICDQIPIHHITSAAVCKKNIIVEEFENEHAAKLYQGLIDSSSLSSNNMNNGNMKMSNTDSNIINDNSLFSLPISSSTTSVQPTINSNVSDLFSVFNFDNANSQTNNTNVNANSNTISNQFDLMNLNSQIDLTSIQNLNPNQNKESQPITYSNDLFDQIMPPSLNQATNSLSNQQQFIPDFTQLSSPSINNVITNHHPQSQTQSLFEQSSSSVSGAMKEVYKTSDVTVYSMLQSEPNSPHNLSGSFFISNNLNKALYNVKLNFSVKKNISLKVISTSANQLDPNASLGIKKEVTIQNNDPTKPIVLKILLSYTNDNDEASMSFLVTI